MINNVIMERMQSDKRSDTSPSLKQLKEVNFHSVERKRQKHTLRLQ